MDRAQKEKVVEELGQIFESSGVVVVAHYTGLTVAEMQDLRARMREAGGSVRVAKNRLAKIALEGKPCASIAELLTGMTVLSYSEDPVAAAKVAEGFAKDNSEVCHPWRRDGRDGSGPGRCQGRVETAVARGAHRFDRRLHRRTCFATSPGPLARLLRTSRASCRPSKSARKRREIASWG